MNIQTWIDGHGNMGVTDEASYRKAHASHIQKKYEKPVVEVDTPVKAFINHSRWVVACECNGGCLTHPEHPVAACFDCGRVYTAASTWVTGELVTAALMNTYIRDNQLAFAGGYMAITSQAAGDVLYASSGTALARLPKDAGKYLKSGASAPSWETLSVNTDRTIILPMTAAELDAYTESYDTANTVTDTVPGTAGYLAEASITMSNTDSLAANDLVTIKFYRDANAGGDTASGDADLYALSLEYTAS